jgi:hypothetical protein
VAELGVHTKKQEATTFLLNIPDLLYLYAVGMRLSACSAIDYSLVCTHRTLLGEQSLSNEEPGKCRLNGLEKRLKLLFSWRNWI